MPADGVTSQWLRGVTDLVLLCCLEREPSYGYALLERLIASGLHPISEATVYGALRRLDTSGLCASSLVASDSGPARRYYELTATGRASLAGLRTEWTRFADAVSAVTGVPAVTEAPEESGVPAVTESPDAGPSPTIASPVEPPTAPSPPAPVPTATHQEGER